jgi:hypothetical protein
MELKRVRMANGTECYSAGVPSTKREPALADWLHAVKWMTAFVGALVLLQQTLPL